MSLALGPALQPGDVMVRDHTAVRHASAIEQVVSAGGGRANLIPEALELVQFAGFDSLHEDVPLGQS